MLCGETLALLGACSGQLAEPQRDPMDFTKSSDFLLGGTVFTARSWPSSFNTTLYYCSVVIILPIIIYFCMLADMNIDEIPNDRKSFQLSSGYLLV